MNQYNLLQKIKILFLIATSFGFIFFTKTSLGSENKNTNLKEEKAINNEILVVPQIKITEKNTLKSYSWWQHKKTKIPKIYKLFLKKIKDDFEKNHLTIKYTIKKFDENSSEDLKQLENVYILSGNLLLNLKEQSDTTLNDLNFYKIKNEKFNLLSLLNTNTYKLGSDFSPLAIQFLNYDKVQNLNINESTPNKNYFYIVFENELSFEELNQIRSAIAEKLKLNEDLVTLYISEKNRYTFRLDINNTPFKKLEDIVFVNGPYKFEIKENFMVFKPYTEKDFMKDQEVDESGA